MDLDMEQAQSSVSCKIFPKNIAYSYIEESGLLRQGVMNELESIWFKVQLMLDWA